PQCHSLYIRNMPRIYMIIYPYDCIVFSIYLYPIFFVCWLVRYAQCIAYIRKVICLYGPHHRKNILLGNILFWIRFMHFKVPCIYLISDFLEYWRRYISTILLETLWVIYNNNTAILRLICRKISSK